MNELQLGLLGLGATAVAGVVAYNKWVERRHRRLAEQVLQRDHADVLLGDDEPRREAPLPVMPVDDGKSSPARDYVAVEPSLKPQLRDQPPLGERVEPILQDDDADRLPDTPEFLVPVIDRADGTDQPVAVHTDTSVPAASQPAPAEVQPDVVSPAIDYVASFDLVEPVSGDQILRSQRDLLSRVSKPIVWGGYSDRTGQWERISEEGAYRRLRIGLLLADRRGPLGEADLLTFQGAMQNLADELMAVVDMPPRDPALDAAIVLDQFCASVDIQVGINLISKGQTFLGTKIRALAEAAGMVLDSSGHFVRCDDDGNVLYTLVNQESAGFSLETMKTMSTHGLVFILDVPCVDHGDRVFAQMLDLARRMADALGGMLVDDNRRPLTEAMLEPFRRQIAQYQAQLAAKGLPAGSPPTLRLFA